MSVEDCYDVYKWVLEKGYKKIIVGGDSALANLALAVMVKAYLEKLKKFGEMFF